jgi:uncharacterized membrane protein YeaQ/YmgE (transglycosylase-associated protein family)
MFLGFGLMWLVWTLVIGIVAGWLAGQIWKGSGFGLLGDMIIGVIGSLLGGFVFGLLGIYAWGFIGRLIISLIGALLLLYLMKLVRRRA